MMPFRRWLVFSLLLALAPLQAREVPAEAVVAPRQAAIASANAYATDAGLEVLAKGGNAFDAAVAVSATLGLVEPESSGLGGGGLMLLHLASEGREVWLPRATCIWMPKARCARAAPSMARWLPRSRVFRPGWRICRKSTARFRFPYRWPRPFVWPVKAG